MSAITVKKTEVDIGLSLFFLRSSQQSESRFIQNSVADRRRSNIDDRNVSHFLVKAKLPFASDGDTEIEQFLISVKVVCDENGVSLNYICVTEIKSKCCLTLGQI